MNNRILNIQPVEYASFNYYRKDYIEIEPYKYWIFAWVISIF